MQITVRHGQRGCNDAGFGLIAPKFGREKCVCTQVEKKGVRKGVSTTIHEAPGRDGRERESEVNKGRCEKTSELRWSFPFTLTCFLLKVCNLMKMTGKIRLKCKYDCNLHPGCFATIVSNFPQSAS